VYDKLFRLFIQSVEPRNSRIPPVSTSAILKIEKLQYLMMQNESITCISDFKLIFKQSMHLGDPFSIIVPNFLEIDHTVAKISGFFAINFFSSEM